MTLPQVRCVMTGGKGLDDRVEDPDEMRDLIRQVQNFE